LPDTRGISLLQRGPKSGGKYGFRGPVGLGDQNEGGAPPPILFPAEGPLLAGFGPAFEASSRLPPACRRHTSCTGAGVGSTNHQKGRFFGFQFRGRVGGGGKPGIPAGGGTPEWGGAGGAAVHSPKAWGEADSLRRSPVPKCGRAPGVAAWAPKRTGAGPLAQLRRELRFRARWATLSWRVSGKGVLGGSEGNCWAGSEKQGRRTPARAQDCSKQRVRRETSSRQFRKNLCSSGPLPGTNPTVAPERGGVGRSRVLWKKTGADSFPSTRPKANGRPHVTFSPKETRGAGVRANSAAWESHPVGHRLDF